MVVQVRLFAVLKELAGTESLDLELAESATVDDALAALRANGALAGAVERMSVVLAVNREYAAGDQVLEPGDELALIPPVSGGQATTGTRAHVRITGELLSIEDVSARVRDARAGAIVTFQGVTREVEVLHYEAYEQMARERIAEILATAIDRHGLCGAAAEHRMGEVALGEPSVVVACSAAHRAEAFAGAREIIDRIKAEAPIWKKEVEAGGERWVEGRTPPRSGD